MSKSVVFFHVMKCGGTSVRAGLALGVAGHREGSDVFELDGSAAKTAAGGDNSDNWRFRDALLPYVLQAMRPAVVLGHFRYRDRYHDLAASSSFVTVLRDPVERVVSLYKYRRYKQGVDIAVTTGFDEFISAKRWEQEGSTYVRTFCGDDDLDPRSDQAIEAAIANLQRFAVVGFTDRLDRFADGVATVAGRPVSMPMLNRSPAPDGADVADMTPGALEQARSVCRPDQRVYDAIRAAASAPAVTTRS